MDTLFFWTLGVALVLLTLSAVLLLISEQKKQKAAEAAFQKANAKKNIQIGDLWLDEDNRKWLIAREGTNLPVHSYDSVQCAEMTVDDAHFIWNNGEICSSKDDTPWQPFGEDHIDHPKGGKEKIAHIYLNIFTTDRVYPIETLVLLSRPVTKTSRAYRTAAAQAAALMKLFNTLKK